MRLLAGFRVLSLVRTAICDLQGPCIQQLQQHDPRQPDVHVQENLKKEKDDAEHEAIPLRYSAHASIGTSKPRQTSMDGVCDGGTPRALFADRGRVERGEVLFPGQWCVLRDEEVTGMFDQAQSLRP
jgi:hypothetical protein